MPTLASPHVCVDQVSRLGESDGEEARRALLTEVHRISTASPFVTLSVLGELVRPFLCGAKLGEELEVSGVATDTRTYQTEAWTRRLCSERFEVLDYIAGGVADEQDLVVLRRP